MSTSSIIYRPASHAASHAASCEGAAAFVGALALGAVAALGVTSARRDGRSNGILHPSVYRQSVSTTSCGHVMVGE